MTKEEYRNKAWDDFYSQSFKNVGDPLIHIKQAFFNAGFNAACEYYKKQVLEL